MIKIIFIVAFVLLTIITVAAISYQLGNEFGYEEGLKDRRRILKRIEEEKNE